LETTLDGVSIQKEVETSICVESVVCGYNGMKRADVGLSLGHLMLFTCFGIIFHIVSSYATGSNSAIKL